MRQQDAVGVVASGDATALVLFVDGQGAAGGVGSERGLDRDALFRVPAVGGLAGGSPLARRR